jgi:lactate dehydrogenase-like 2-hydroxyacid dehydrogenase
LRVIANFAVGVDNIDLAATRARGITVTNTPDVLTAATAELALALTLALMRRVAEGDRLIRAGTPWEFGLDFMVGEGLAGKKVAIVGAGRIGREAARLFQAFGASAVLVSRGDPLAELLADADVVSLHCPLTDSTHHLIDDALLRRLRRSAIVVNTSRGPVIHESALVAALRERRIAGAALDVFEFEPRVSDELLAMQNVVLTPHLGSATQDARNAMGMLVVHALESVLTKGAEPKNLVS